jgi:hypothetical protein
MTKLPAFQFYPGDWRKDVGVQSLDYFDRGVWWEMLCLMHESERRGVLVLNGQAMSEDALARLLGLDKQKLTTILTALLTSGVASREAETGAIMCRRMVRDEKLREIRTEAGKKGGNPVLLNQKTTTEVKPAPKQNPTPSSSSSTSVSTAKTNAPEGAKNAPSSSNDLFPELVQPAAESLETPALDDEIAVTTSENPLWLKALKEVFAYYLAVMKRNPKTYSFTALRRRKGLMRLEEALRIAGGNLANAVELMKAVIDEVALSDWHMGRNPKTEGKAYCEWEDHIFRSTEQFEHWLQRAQEPSGKGVARG